MTRSRRLLPLVGLTAALGAALLVAPGAATTWVHVYLVVVAASVLIAATRELARRSSAPPSIVDSALAPRPQHGARPEDLELLERLVLIGSASAFDVHYRLRPALRTIAEGILFRGGIDLETQPEPAHAALGDAAWSLLRPNRPAPEDRQAGGLALSDLDAVVRGIEGAR